MTQLLIMARTAAASVAGDVADVSHVTSEPSGVEVFSAARTGGGSITVSINPNGRAGVEWSGGYRVLAPAGLACLEQGARP